MKKTTLSESGELGLLKVLGPMLRRHTEGLPLGTGDDVAITDEGQGRRMVWTLDTMVEGTHFKWWNHPEATARALAWRLVSANVSDLASKGAKPLYTLVSLAVPGETSLETIKDFYTGLDEACCQYGLKLIGGDTVKAPQWTITLAVTGELHGAVSIAARSKAQSGMNVFVTGCPGESAAGLAILQGELIVTDKKVETELVRRFFHPTPRLDAGKALAQAFPDLAMIDVSDGVVADAGQIARQSGVAVHLEEERLPISRALKCVEEKAEELLLHGGEDFELLFATDHSPEEVQRVCDGAGINCYIHQIGVVREGQGVFLDGQAIGRSGFEHFDG